MADNVDFLSPDEPRPSSTRPEGDLPADFFDDAAEPSPLTTPPPPTPEWSPPHNPPPPPTPPPDPEPAAPVGGGSAARVVLGLLMLGGFAATVAAAMVSNPQTPTAKAAAPEATAEAKEAPAWSGRVEALKKDLQARLDSLTGRFKTLETKVTDLPKPAPAADLTPIQGKVDDLGKAVARIDELAEKVDKIDKRLADLDGALKSTKDDLAKLADEAKKAPPAAATPTPTPEAEPKPDEAALAMDRGVDLFKSGKYQDAFDTFKALEAGDSKDARVYYYAALSRGMATNDWKGETLTIAAKGAELEKSGATKPADVDAVFSDLSATLKPWLTYFRKSAKP